MKMFKHQSALFAGLIILFLLSVSPQLVQAQEVGAGNIEMVFVPSGTFTMGCSFEQINNCAYDEKPAHQVTLKGFALAKYEVTQKLWKEIMGSNPSQIIGDDLPVHNVSWDDIQIFIQRLNAKTGMNYRLPTEAEWEYAARGGNQQGDIPFLYSGSNELTSVAWFNENSDSKPQAVGTKQPNALGLYDMSGNVWEWCNDLYELYNDKPQDNPTGAVKGISRVTRGGCYAGLATQCRVTTRKSTYQGGRDAATGFRLAMDDDREAKAAEAAWQAEQDSIAAEKAAAAAAKKAEQERLAAERAAEQERLAAERTAEQERLAAEKAAEQERLAAEKAAAEAAKKAEQERLAAERAAEQERLAAEKAAAEAAKKAEQERLAAERAAEQERLAAERAEAHQLKVEKRQARLDAIPSSVFFTLNAAYTSMPQWSYGFKIGTTRVAGWYFSAMTNFNYKGAFSSFRNNQHYALTGVSKTTYLGGQFGLVIRPCMPLSIHIGAGFAYRTLNFETDEGWYNYHKRNYYGPTASFGFMFHIKGFVISAEATGMAYNLNTKNQSIYSLGARAGIGFCLPYDKNKKGGKE